MKRLRSFAFFIARGVVALVILVVIGLLGRGIVLGAQDLAGALNTQRQHDQQVAGFPGAATQIAINNATLGYLRTHAPTDTPTATDTPDQPNPDDGSAPTDLPTDVSQPSGRFGSVPLADAPTATLSGPPPTNTPRPTMTPLAVTITLTPSPTVYVAATVPPTFVKPTVALLQPPPLSRAQVTAVPSPAPRLKSANDIVNVVLTGSDADGTDPGDPSSRTDSMIVVSINRTANSVSMLSLPRDLFVFIPTLGMQRLNDAFIVGESIHYQPGGGFGLLQQTILYNFGIPVHFYARVSFNGFKKMIDTINGVDVAVDCPVTDLRYQGPIDNHTPEPAEYTLFTLNPGYYHMNGSLALWYARMRHASSDFDRSRRQQQVLRAIWKTARTQGLIDLTKISDLWTQATSIVQTSLTLPDVIGLAPIALSLNPGDVTSYYMSKGYETQHWKTPAGEDVQLPEPKGFFDTINRFYTPPSKNRLAAQGLNIDIINGSGVADLDKVAGDRLSWGGFAATPKGAGDATAKTVVYDYTGGANPGTLVALLKALNVKQSAVQSQPDPNRTVDFKIVLGADYNSCSAPGYAAK